MKISRIYFFIWMSFVMSYVLPKTYFLCTGLFQMSVLYLSRHMRMCVCVCVCVCVCICVYVCLCLYYQFNFAKQFWHWNENNNCSNALWVIVAHKTTINRQKCKVTKNFHHKTKACLSSNANIHLIWNRHNRIAIKS